MLKLCLGLCFAKKPWQCLVEISGNITPATVSVTSVQHLYEVRDLFQGTPNVSHDYTHVPMLSPTASWCSTLVKHRIYGHDECTSALCVFYLPSSSSLL